MTFTEKAWGIFRTAVDDYHKADHIDADFVNPHPANTIEAALYRKCWIDTVQWHMEDIIRDPNIDPVEALALKRRIDKSNQDRTDLVEQIDHYFLETYKDVRPLDGATLNTETPAWAADRLSILYLKIYHMEEQVSRQEADAAHRERCQAKLAVLREQKQDLSGALDTLLTDIAEGRKYMKLYKQMKMYNDPATNPILYGAKGK